MSEQAKGALAGITDWDEATMGEARELAKALNPTLEERVAGLESSLSEVKRVFYLEIMEATRGAEAGPVDMALPVFVTPFGTVQRDGGCWVLVKGALPENPIVL